MLLLFAIWINVWNCISWCKSDNEIDKISEKQELEITDLASKADAELELQRTTIEEVDETYREMEDSIKVKQDERDAAISELTTAAANAQTEEKRKELTDEIKKKQEEHRTEVKTIRSNTEEVVAQKRQDGGLGKFSAAKTKSWMPSKGEDERAIEDQRLAGLLEGKADIKPKKAVSDLMADYLKEWSQRVLPAIWMPLSIV